MNYPVSGTAASCQALGLKWTPPGMILLSSTSLFRPLRRSFGVGWCSELAMPAGGSTQPIRVCAALGGQPLFSLTAPTLH
eukprot:4816902-Pyramimonas_sp.AAC.1